MCICVYMYMYIRTSISIARYIVGQFADPWTWAVYTSISRWSVIVLILSPHVLSIEQI